MKILMPLFVALATTGVPQVHDLLLKAMNDEMARSVNQLKLDKHEKPYYVGYHLSDIESVDVSGSFGAITSNHRVRYRTAWTDVHVGSYKLDSGNMRPEYYTDQVNSGAISLDDNYEAIRHALWLQTDVAYKSAVQSLERKKAALQERNTKERPDDWSHEQPEVLIEPLLKLTTDRAQWAAKIKNLSAIFKAYPRIRQSSVSITHVAENRYFVNNEGAQSRVGETVSQLNVSATAQGADGMKVSDSFELGAIDDQHLSSSEEIEAKIKEFAQDLEKVLDAKEAELYQGPVLFEREAACQFINKALVPNIVVKRQYDADRSRHGQDGLEGRIGKRILPSFISVVDDPTMTDSTGAKLPTSYDIDDEGVRGQKVELVEKGILKTLLSTRLPTLKVKKSNGHARGSHFFGNDFCQASNIIVQSDHKLSAEAMRKKLLDLGKEDGLDYVLIVRKLSSGQPTDAIGQIIYISDELSSSETLKGKVDLPMALNLSRLYADGHEEPVRGAEFTACTVKILRDIVATGDQSLLYIETNTPNTVISPSLLIRDVEIQKSRSDLDKPPILPHPFFEKKS